MSNNQKLEKLEKLTFRELIKKHKIEIPIIQRDYAQGREGKQELRNNFLNSLRDAIVNEKPLELDFVYGSVKDNGLQPLDGQQRLTTLFLLHWYAAVKEDKLNDEKNCLKKFSYETRTSSREFCNELVEKGIVYTDEKKISEVIIDSSWFFLSWQKDPTIKAMLNMLDAIQQKFKNEKTIWDKLNNVSFQYIELKDFDLTDDLYIKMNARGKPLTDFENFKAKFEQYIDEQKWEEGTAFTESFSYKIDTIWTDLLWSYRGADNITDDEMINFIAGIAINFYAEKLQIAINEDEQERVKKDLEEKRETKKISDDAIKRERIEQRMMRIFNDANEIKVDDFPTEESFIYLKECLNKYAEKKEDIFHFAELAPKVDLWKYCQETLFKNILESNKMEWQNRVLFYAQTEYLLNNQEFIADKFDDWMRVVRNIVENSTVDSASTFIGAINLINELSTWCNSIYEGLPNVIIQSSFAREQSKEEAIKSRIIANDALIKQLLFDLEDTVFCKGRLSFILYCVGIDIELPYAENFEKNSLKKLFDIIKSNFENDDKYELFVRAFLTIKSNDYYEGWWHWSYSFDCMKGYFYSPTRMKTGKGSNYKGFSELKEWQREYLRELFLQLVEKGSFKSIIDDYNIPNDMPNWKKRLIKEDNLLNDAEYILVPNDNSYCKLAWQQKPTVEEQVEEII